MCQHGNVKLYMNRIEKYEAEFVTLGRKLTRKWDVLTEQEADRVGIVLFMAMQVLKGADWPRWMKEAHGQDLRKWYEVEKIKKNPAD